MFDDLKIRNKLVLLVAGPLVIILLLAALGAVDRQRTAEQSAEVVALVSVAQANSDVVDALQREALFSSGFVGSERTEFASEVEEARAVTDSALTTALSRMNSRLDSSAGFRSSAALAIDSADKLTYLRLAIDEGYSWDQAASSLATIQDNFLAVNDTIAGTVSDPQVAGQLRTSSALASYKAALAFQGSLLVGVNGAGDFSSPGSFTVFDENVDREVRQRAIMNQLADAGDKGAIRDALVGSGLDTIESARTSALRAGEDGEVNGNPGDLQDATGEVITNLHSVESQLLTRLISEAESNKSNAERAARFFLIAAFVAVLAAAAAALLLGRRITRPLNNLTEAADRLANEQMPKLVESLKNPSEEEVNAQLSQMADIEVTSNDEIGQLAGAFNNVQRVAGEVAAEQAILLRKGIGEMFVNLARRNQALLDRQIEFIDELERGEEDPDQLENLYRLDHLATRMRRNAESLLVLAGAEPPRRRGRPAPLANVVRAALAEVEDFARIELVSLDEVLVASNSAADIAHLLSELMENATNFSPPETRVEIVGHRTKADGYVVSVTDHGIGMSADQISDANEMLARPPLVGLALSRSLGFIVVGRLAARHGISVKMMPSPSGGATAVVSLPSSLVTDGPGASGMLPAAAPAAPVVEAPRLQPVPAVAEDTSSVPPLTFQPYDAPDSDIPAPTPAAPAAEHVTSPAGASQAGGPLTFDQPRGGDSDTPSGPSRSAPTGDRTNGLPTRRLTASPAPTRTSTPEPVTAEHQDVPPVVDDAPSPDLEPESATADAGSEPLAGNLDGPPPAAPPLPSRSAAPRPPVPTVTSAPGSADGSKPFFLEEAEPPRLFGRSANTEPAAAPAGDGPPRLFGAGSSTPPAAPVPSTPAPDSPLPGRAPAGGVPPLARRGGEPSADAPSNGNAEPAADVRTNSGLAKRTPRSAGGARAIPGADAERGVSATRRSPEEVRNLLSRYRDGQQRARVTEQVPAGPAEENEPDE